MKVKYKLIIEKLKKALIHDQIHVQARIEIVSDARRFQESASNSRTGDGAHVNDNCSHIL